MATLADIARALDLNKTTVSKALNNSSDISLETKERVLAEADRIGYTKHKYKKNSKNHVNLIGIICPEVVSHYYAQIATFLSTTLQKKGYGTILMLSGFSPAMESTHLAQLVQLNVSGVIIITEQTDISEAVSSVPGAGGIPMVIMGLNYASKDHDVVSVDEKYGILSLVEHLVEKGHQRIAFLGDNLVSNRLNYFKQIMAQKSLCLPEEYIILSDKRNEECGYEGMRKLMTLKTPPTAVLNGYDRIALGAYRAASEMNLRVPEDVALAGFDDADFCRYLPQKLTSVNYDVVAECRVASAILLNRIRESDAQFTQTVAITPRLIAREST